METALTSSCESKCLEWLRRKINRPSFGHNMAFQSATVAPSPARRRFCCPLKGGVLGGVGSFDAMMVFVLHLGLRCGCVAFAAGADDVLPAIDVACEAGRTSCHFAVGRLPQ
eukprot:3330019-Amphidinium_carterae.1